MLELNFMPTLQIEMKEELAVTDIKGNEQGHLSVELIPCKANGSLYDDDDEDLFVEEPKQQVSTFT